METKKNYWYLTPYVLILLLSLFLVITINMIHKKDTIITTKEQNLKALNDSVRVSVNKIGELEYSKNILVTNNSELKQYNTELYELLKRSEGKISELTQYVAHIDNKVSQNIKTDAVKYSDFSYGLKWSYDTIYNKNNSRHLAGETFFDVDFDNGKTKINPNGTKIYTDVTNFKVTQGLRKLGDNIEVFVTSDHPNFKISEMNSVIINPKEHVSQEFVKPDKKRFGLGLSAGYGVGKNGLTPYVGFGINYNALRF